MLTTLIFFSFLMKTCSFHGGVISQFVDVYFQTTAICQIVNSSWCMEVFHLEEDTSSYEGIGYGKFRCYPPDYVPSFMSSDRFTGDGLFNPTLEIVVGYRHNCTSDGSTREYVALTRDVSIWQGKETIEITTILNDEGQTASQTARNKDYFKGYNIIYRKQF